jgi:hypothetical protein
LAVSWAIPAGASHRDRVAGRVAARVGRGLEGDLRVAEQPHGLDDRARVARDLAAVVDLQVDDERAVVAQHHVAHVAHLHAGEAHGLADLEVLAPAEHRVQRVAGPEAAAHQPHGAADADDQRHREQEADEDLVASSHVRTWKEKRPPRGPPRQPAT